MVAVVVLLLGFGSVLAAGLPILTALLGLATALGMLGMAAAASTFPSVSPTLAVMMGLGVGIDYALFLTTRHRQQVMDGADPAEAAGRTVSTSGRAVLIAAATVIIAMLGLYASGIGFIGKLGLAAAITSRSVRWARSPWSRPCSGWPAGASTGSGYAVPSPRPRPVTQAGPGTPPRSARTRGGSSGRGLLLGVLAIPLLSLQLGHVDAGADPASYTTSRPTTRSARGSGPGANGPFTVVVQLATQPDRGQVQQLAGRVQHRPGRRPGRGRGKPGPGQPGRRHPGRHGRAQVAAAGPRPPARCWAHCADTTLPDALSGTGARGYVTGLTAAQLDFRNEVGRQLPVIIGVVIAAAFLLLLATFRSPVLALKAAAATCSRSARPTA